MQAVLLDDLLQVAAGEQLHRVEQRTAGRDVGLIDADDVRVIEAADALDLVDEQAARLGAGCDSAVQHFDGNVAVDRELPREVDVAKAAARDLALDLEASRQHGAHELFVDLRSRTASGW